MRVSAERPKRARVEKEYVKILRPHLHFHGIQIKSEECFRHFASHVDALESLVGIHETRISLEEIFVCPDVDLDAILQDSRTPVTPMEKLLIGLIRKIKCKGRDY